MIRLSATVASLAALAMTGTPAIALERAPTALSGAMGAAVTPEAQGWGYGYGYGPGYGPGYGRHRDNGIDAGDVIAGVLVIGAIAAIASAASNNSRERYEENYPRRSPQPANYPADYRENYRTSDTGIDRAVDMCVDQVERGSARVDSVDEAARRADGWRVAGRMSNGESWNCWIDNDGRLRSLDFGEGYGGSYVEPGYISAAASGQLSDEAYSRARAAAGRVAPGETYAGGGVDADLGNGPVPAYPGGPLPGEEGYEEAVRS